MAEALETTLQHVVATSRVAACETLLTSRSQSYQKNGELLRQLAARLGFRTDKIGHLLQVPPGRIRALRDGAVDLQALVAVTLMAAHGDSDHPLCAVAAIFPDWLVFLGDLKNLRDAGAHGHTRKADLSRLKKLQNETYLSIERLIPALARKENAPEPTHTSTTMKTVHDARRKAISSLERHFGVKWYATLGPDTNRAPDPSRTGRRFARGDGGVQNVARLVNDLASVLQAVVHAQQPIAGTDPPPNEQLTNTARNCAITAGLLATDAELPQCLRSVNPRQLGEALQGQSPSLGASVLALLVRSPLERLKRLALASPPFLDLTAGLIDLRGHGNRPVLMHCRNFAAKSRCLPDL